MATRYCATCKTTDRKLFYCGKCRSVYYCSVECQKKSWLASHRNHCHNLGCLILERRAFRDSLNTLYEQKRWEMALKPGQTAILAIFEIRRYGNENGTYWRILRLPTGIQSLLELPDYRKRVKEWSLEFVEMLREKHVFSECYICSSRLDQIYMNHAIMGEDDVPVVVCFPILPVCGDEDCQNHAKQYGYQHAEELTGKERKRRGD